MNFRVDATTFLGLTGEIKVLDVRTPSEFIRGHIPGAINIPLFSDEERAVVGTIYKKKGRTEAVLRGLDFVGVRMRELLKEGLKHAGKSGKIALYCWRGGMRSDSMAWLFRQGEIETHILEGGYKAYRNHIHEEFVKPRNVIILGGLTGSGKTDILKEIRAMGEQVVDLEDIASHKGSAFGSLGQAPQPTTEHFANLLHLELSSKDPDKRIFIEDESRNIGSVFLPDEIYDLIRDSHVIAVMTDSSTRMPRLMEEYGRFDPGLLIGSLEKISKRLGGELTTEAIESVKSGDIRRAIEIVLLYYDKYYRYGLSKRDSSTVSIVETLSGDAKVNALKVIGAADLLP